MPFQPHPGAEPRRQAGFSLPEVLVGVLLVGGVAFGIMSFVGTSMKLNRLALERTTATQLATERLDDITTMDFQSAAAHANYKLSFETESDGATDEWIFTSDYGSIPSYPDFKRVTTLSYGTPEPQMLKVKVVVTWDNLAQGEKSHTMIDFLYPDLERMQ